MPYITSENLAAKAVVEDVRVAKNLQVQYSAAFVRTIFVVTSGRYKLSRHCDRTCRWATVMFGSLQLQFGSSCGENVPSV